MSRFSDFYPPCASPNMGAIAYEHYCRGRDRFGNQFPDIPWRELPPSTQAGWDEAAWAVMRALFAWGLYFERYTAMMQSRKVLETKKSTRRKPSTKGKAMPKGYEKMRDAFLRKGLPKKQAQSKAARIWNAAHPARPVTGKKHG